jgi:uncharacterized DUF497 family protein
MSIPDFSAVSGFDWDEGNAMKGEKHAVLAAEAEQVFVNEPLVVLEDVAHSVAEPRWHALGHTNGGRLLHITFTLRAGATRVRIISARPMHRKERVAYGKASQAGS